MKTSFEGKKLYAVIIAVLLIITFFITFHIIRNHYKYIFKKVITDNTLTANLLSSLMYEHQKAAISILESYAQRPLFIDAVKKKDFHRAFYHLKSLSEHHTENDALFITDKSGTLWANYPMDSKGFGKNLAYRDWYKGVSKKWRPYISSVYRLIVLEKGLAVAVSVPVFDRKGKVIGILSGAQRTAFLDTFIKDNIIDPEKNITLLDQEGNIIFSNAVPYQEKITKYPDAHVLEKALAGVFIDMEIADAKEKGSISYVSIAPVRGIGWSVIVGQEKNAILKSLYRYFILSAVAGLVIFLFLTVSLLYFRREYRYRKTKELQESEERLRTIVEASLDAIMAVNAEGRLVLFNGAAQELFQYSEEEALNQPVDILLREEIGKIHQERLEKFLKRGVGQCGHIGRRMEKFFRRKDGSLFVAEVSMSGGRLDGLRLVVLAIHDITSRKQAEEALRRSEENFRRSLDDSPLGVRIVTIEGETIYANRAILDIYDFDSIEELKTTPTKNRYTPQSYAEFKIRREKRKGDDDGPYEYEISIVRKKGEVRHLQVLRKEILWNGERQFQTIYRDITERKQVEEAVRERDIQLKKLTSWVPGMIYQFTKRPDGTYCVPFTTEAIKGILGCSPQDVREDFSPIARIILPEDFDKVVGSIEYSAKHLTIWTCEYRVQIPGQSIRWLLGNSTPEKLADGSITWYGFNTDITERKQAEEARRESEARYRSLFENNHAVMLLIDPDNAAITDANPAACAYYGWSREELKKRRIDEINTLTSKEVSAEMQLALSEKRNQFFFKHRRADGTIRDVEVYSGPILLKGKFLLYSIVHDITERKRTEELLRESEEKNRALFEDCPIESLVVTLEGEIIQYNKIFERSSEKRGRRLPEIGSRMYVDYASNHSIDMRTELIDCINSKTPKTFNEMPYKGRFLNISMAPTREGAIISAIDVTERKQAEESLRVSEENFRRSMDESPLGIGIVSEEGEILYVNRTILDFFGYESIEELRETPFTKRYTKSGYAVFLDRREKRRLHADDSSDYEIDIVRKDGEVRHLQVWRKRVLWNGKEHYQVIYRDITERKQAEERIHASLREKEILLREIHHRVKNNMQVISSLLDLQASSSKNPELIAMFHESQSRIRAMSLVHEKLYASNDFARIDLAGYVRALSQELFQSYKINSGEIALIFQADGDVYVDINKAIPCGLILNELISNALKHAFPRDRHGELQIIMRETKNTEIEIVVRDNGIGLPDDVDIHQPRTVGLHLVNGLVKNQLDGQMEVRRDNGTEFRIKFPL
jgi:PAS domain S-box-containing protein